MEKSAVTYVEPHYGLKGRFLRYISSAIDTFVVRVENRMKGQRSHLSRRLDLPEYNTDDLLAAPEKFYDVGLKMPDLELERRHKFLGIRVSHFSFDSEIKTKYPENNNVYGRVFEARGQTGGKHSPCILIYHGWRESGAFAPYYYILGFVLARMAMNCVFLNLPYHGKRTPIGATTGELMLNGDMEHSINAFRQAVCDGRSTVSWLKTHFRGPIGVMGLSLGGFVALVLSCVDDRIDFAIPIISSGNIIKNMWKTDVGRSIVRDFDKVGLTEEQVEQNWKIICPIHMKSKLSPERILPIAGRFDKLIPAENVWDLKIAWKLPVIKWHQCGHISIFLFYRRIVRQIAIFVHGVRFMDD